MLVLEAHEVAALADAVPDKYRALVLTAATTGLRAGELYALRRRDVDLNTGKLTVARALKAVGGGDPPVFGPPKTGRWRTLTVPTDLRPVLAKQLLGCGGGEEALVFANHAGEPICHTAFVRNHFRPAVLAALPAGKRRLRWHDLRHTCASLLIAQGYPADAIKAYLGHASITTTFDRYGHLLPSRDGALTEARDAAFAEAFGPHAEVAAMPGR